MVYIGIIIGVIVLDRISKILALSYLSKIDTFPLIEEVFHLTYFENTGAAFSILSSNTNFLIVLTTIFIGILVYILYKEYKKENSNKIFLYSLGIIIGGAIGNLIDRVYYGFVVDYFDFRLINFAVFNVADSFICIGAFFIILLLIFDKNFDF